MLTLLLRRILLLRCFWISSKRGGGSVSGSGLGTAVCNSQLLPLLPLRLLITVERVLVGAAACDIVVIDLIGLRNTLALTILPRQELIEQPIHMRITSQTCHLPKKKQQQQQLSKGYARST